VNARAFELNSSYGFYGWVLARSVRAVPFVRDQDVRICGNKEPIL